MPDAHVRQGLELAGVIDHAGGIGGVIEDDGFGLGGDGLLQLFGGDLEVLFLRGWKHDWDPAHDADQLIVTHPGGGGEDHLVPRVHQGPERQVDHMLGTAGDHHLGGGVVHAAVGFHTVTGGLLELHHAGGGGVAGKIIPDGLVGGLLDMVRGIEIGFTRGKANHVLPLRLHLLVEAVNGHGGGGAYASGDPGKLFHRSFLPYGNNFKHDNIIGGDPRFCKSPPRVSPLLRNYAENKSCFWFK